MGLQVLECGGKTPLLGPRHVAARKSAVVPAQSKRGHKVANRQDEARKWINHG